MGEREGDGDGARAGDLGGSRKAAGDLGGFGDAAAGDGRAGGLLTHRRSGSPIGIPLRPASGPRRAGRANLGNQTSRWIYSEHWDFIASPSTTPLCWKFLVRKLAVGPPLRAIPNLCCRWLSTDRVQSASKYGCDVTQLHIHLQMQRQMQT